MIYTSNHFSEELFCDVMITHYQELLRRRVKGWKFVSAAFAFKKIKYYQQLKAHLHNELVEAQTTVNNVLTEINQNHGQPTITCAS